MAGWRDLFKIDIEREGEGDPPTRTKGKADPADLSEDEIEAILAEEKAKAGRPKGAGGRASGPGAPPPLTPTGAPGAAPPPNGLPAVPRVFPLDQVYTAASVPEPPNGYGIERLRGVMFSKRMQEMTPEMRVGSVMAALEMTGVPVAQIAQDAAARAAVLADYGNHLQGRVASAVGARRAAISTLEADIAAYVATRRGEIAGLEGEIKAAEAALAEFANLRSAEENSMHAALDPLVPAGSNPIRPPNNTPAPFSTPSLPGSNPWTGPR